VPPLTYYRPKDPKSSFRIAADHYIRNLADRGAVVCEEDLDFRPSKLRRRRPRSPVAIVHPLFFFNAWYGSSFEEVIGSLKERHQVVLGMEVADSTLISRRFAAWANHPLVDGIILPSQACCEAFRRSGVVAPITCVPHGVSPVPPSAAFDFLKQDLRPRILVFAMHSPERKGWDLVQRLIPEFPDCLFVIRASRRAQTYFRGFRNALIVRKWLSLRDLASLYVNCDVLLSLHRGGAFEMNCSEALSYGLPVIATRYGGVLDYLNEENASLIEVASLEPIYPEGTNDHCGLGAVPDLADARAKLRNLVSNLEAAKRRAARAKDVFVTEWSWPRATQQLVRSVQQSAGSPASFPRGPEAAANRIRVNYRGPVFDTTGYGTAARAYVHALHEAGLEITVQNVSMMGAPPKRSAFIESLIRPRTKSDIEIFHGVPFLWSREASKVRNAIGMLTWETDRMPSEWRDPLWRAADVWVPCEFNQAVLGSELSRIPFRLPHPAFVRETEWSHEKISQFLRVGDEEFVVYSIFEWQKRKNPAAMIRAYLKAFDGGERTVLLIKTDTKARSEAERTLSDERAETRSSARVELRCEHWDDAAIGALHHRGDCYLSLHSGEGWCYPLFDAVCRGKPAVATQYSGPLDYLDPAVHCLVPFRLTPVNQKHVYYNSEMQWAEPDCCSAAQSLRFVFDHRSSIVTLTSEAGRRICDRFSRANVGKMALERIRYVLGES